MKCVSYGGSKIFNGKITRSNTTIRRAPQHKYKKNIWWKDREEAKKKTVAKAPYRHGFFT